MQDARTCHTGFFVSKRRHHFRWVGQQPLRLERCIDNTQASVAHPQGDTEYTTWSAAPPLPLPTSVEGQYLLVLGNIITSRGR